MAGHRRLIAQECRSCRWQSSLPKSPLVLRQVTHKANPLSPLQQIPQAYINTSNMSRTRICWNISGAGGETWDIHGYTGIIDYSGIHSESTSSMPSISSSRSSSAWSKTLRQLRHPGILWASKNCGNGRPRLRRD